MIVPVEVEAPAAAAAGVVQEVRAAAVRAAVAAAVRAAVQVVAAAARAAVPAHSDGQKAP